ncbi:MAG: hypothetical protein VCE75_27515 [Alphaproteobacteria bacterium]
MNIAARPWPDAAGNGACGHDISPWRGDYHDLDALVLILLRFALAALLFWPIVVWRYGLPLPGWRNFLRYAVISAFLVGFF